eukprot:SAG22_NODE_4087_length_1390_cov_6.512006_2_plen_68_part_00
MPCYGSERERERGRGREREIKRERATRHRQEPHLHVVGVHREVGDALGRGGRRLRVGRDGRQGKALS